MRATLLYHGHSTFAVRLAAGLTFCLAVGLFCTSARASTLKTLYSFCGQANCADGQRPGTALLMDKDGRLYGTATSGGDSGHGTAFGLTPSLGKTKWKFQRLHSFCAKDGCTDGQDPDGSLIVDTSGNLYGTTYGENLGTPMGTVFELIPQGRRWKHKILRDFDKGHGRAGENPLGGLSYQGQISGQPYDGSSTLYGTNSWGGRRSLGTVYQLAPNGDGRWDLEKPYRFSGGNDGYNPWYGVLLDQSGNMYGTNFSGGSRGSVYKLRFDGRDWAETTLHVIGNPVGPLVMDSSGFLFGVSNTGGAYGGGFVFKILSDGSQYAVLYDFCSMANCSDGQYPTEGVIRDNSGSLYGVAQGGAYSDGVVFKLAFDGTSWKETVLHDFCSLKNCRDGAGPYGGLIVDAVGNLYGTTLNGGRFNGGTVFELSP